jgi:hypothetical protein
VYAAPNQLLLSNHRSYPPEDRREVLVVADEREVDPKEEEEKDPRYGLKGEPHDSSAAWELADARGEGRDPDLDNQALRVTSPQLLWYALKILEGFDVWVLTQTQCSLCTSLPLPEIAEDLPSGGHGHDETCVDEVGLSLPHEGAELLRDCVPGTLAARAQGRSLALSSKVTIPT